MQQSSVPPTASQLASNTDFQWALNGPGHDVQFFDSDECLTRVVVGFLAEGLRVGQSVVSIASTFHCAAFKEALAEQGFDVEALQAYCSLSMRARCSRPFSSTVRLIRSVFAALSAMSSSAPAVVIVSSGYGEAVDLLWKAGDPPAALRLEQLWNGLASDFHFALVCGYTLDNFMAPHCAGAFEDVCGQHHRVISTDPTSSCFDKL